MKFPNHKCDLILHHNPHKGDYETIQQWVAENKMYEWKDSESLRRAIATNEIWTLQWYPETPIGFLAVASPTLEELLYFSCSEDGGS